MFIAALVYQKASKLKHLPCKERSQKRATGLHMKIVARMLPMPYPMKMVAVTYTARRNLTAVKMRWYRASIEALVVLRRSLYRIWHAKNDLRT